jgi:Lipopolysaccharide kinase (Kdo/WaaP) family
MPFSISSNNSLASSSLSSDALQDGEAEPSIPVHHAICGNMALKIPVEWLDQEVNMLNPQSNSAYKKSILNCALDIFKGNTAAASVVAHDQGGRFEFTRGPLHSPITYTVEYVRHPDRPEELCHVRISRKDEVLVEIGRDDLVASEGFHSYKSMARTYRNPALRKIKDEYGVKHYQLDDISLYTHYPKTAENKGLLARERIAAGGLHEIYGRKNANSTVYIKIMRDLDPRNPGHVVTDETGGGGDVPTEARIIDQSEVLNDIAFLLSNDDEETVQMRKYFAVEVLKEIRGGKSVYYTPAVNGFSLYDYLQAPQDYAKELPVELLMSKLSDLKNAVAWLFKNNFIHGDINRLNILYDKDSQNFVLIDFEMASETDDPEDWNEEMEDFAEVEEYCISVIRDAQSRTA